VEIEGGLTILHCLEAYYGRGFLKTDYVVKMKVAVSHLKFT